MPIFHKFFQTDFTGGFSTHNAIIDTTPYKPEVMIVGTFNPDSPHANFADFFYGRNCLWPAFKNLFIHNQTILTGRRMPPNGVAIPPFDPTLEEILELCNKLKLTFTDLVGGVLHQGEPEYELLQNDNVIINGQEYNLILDSQQNGIGGLQQLNGIGQVMWNTEHIISYLIENPQIKDIYITRRPTGVWAGQWNAIVNHHNLQERNFTNIFTPSAQGAPVHRSMERLLHHWVHNENPNFGTLNNDWLEHHGVNIQNF